VARLKPRPFKAQELQSKGKNSEAVVLALLFAGDRNYSAIAGHQTSRSEVECAVCAGSVQSFSLQIRAIVFIPKEGPTRVVNSRRPTDVSFRKYRVLLAGYFGDLAV